MVTVALIGPDGAGKSTLSKELERTLPVPAKTIYMGVNMDAANLMLPTTRLARALGRRRAEPREGSGSNGETNGGDEGFSSLKRNAKRLLWFGNLVAEEWFRQARASYYKRRGFIVVFDRHFFSDYYASDIAPGVAERPLLRQLHGFMLAKLYPKPDLTIYLDVPAQRLFDRKGEGTVEWLEMRREQYLELAEHLPHFTRVDASRPVETVIRDLVSIVTAFYERAQQPPLEPA
jgi:thymidylate kinase